MSETMYHGTAKERMRSIKSRGLLKGSFVTPELDVAKQFAKSRGQWNGIESIVLEVEGCISPVTRDRQGRSEYYFIETGLGERESGHWLLDGIRMEIKSRIPDDWDMYHSPTCSLICASDCPSENYRIHGIWRLWGEWKGIHERFDQLQRQQADIHNIVQELEKRRCGF